MGTWFVGRLQTRQDVDRIIDGLGGKPDGGFDKEKIRKLLANLQKRTFFLKSAHLDEIRLFTTRWVLSFLKGPLKRDEIAFLMKDKKEKGPSLVGGEEKTTKKFLKEKNALSSLPIISEKIPQVYQPVLPGGEFQYEPWVGAKERITFYNQTHGIDKTKTFCLEIRIDPEEKEIPWDKAIACEEDFENYPKNPPSSAAFCPLPSFMTTARDCKPFEKALADYLYQTQRVTLFRCRKLKLKSSPGEPLTDFKVKIQDTLQELKESEIERIQEKFDKKEKIIQRRYARTKEKLQKEEADIQSEATDSLINAGIAVLGALFGRRSAGRVGTALKSGKQVLKERGDVSRARERVQEIEQEFAELEKNLKDKIEQLDKKYNAGNFPFNEIAVKPKRSDLSVQSCVLVWNEA